jgi:hypothetical protein
MIQVSVSLTQMIAAISIHGRLRFHQRNRSETRLARWHRSRDVGNISPVLMTHFRKRRLKAFAAINTC